MLAKMIDKIVALKETKTFEIAGQTYADAPLTRIPPHVDRPDCISVSGLDGICKLIRTELAKINTVIMVQAKSYKSVEVMTTYLPDFSRNILYRAEADVPGLRTGFRSREVALIELRSLFIPNEGTAYLKSIHGVGNKVADCVLLFGLHRVEAFPVDTWIRQVIDEHYGGKFPVEHYDGHAGIIQQFIFYYMQQHKGGKTT